MKRIALKISKELSIDRAQRATEGVAFLNECFTEFNTVIESGNPLEKNIENFLALVPAKIPKPGSLASIAAAIGGSPRNIEMAKPRISTLWEKMRHDALDHPSVESSTPPSEEV